MTTGNVLLAIGAAFLPDGSSGNAAPGIARVKSSAGAPSPFFLQLAFDGTTDQMCSWTFRMPDNYASGPALKVQHKMFSATSGSIRWEGRISAVTPGGSENANSRGFDTTNSVGTTAPGTVGLTVEGSITLTNADSLAPGDLVTVYLRRDADGTTGTDDVTSNAEVVAVSLSYVTI